MANPASKTRGASTLQYQQYLWGELITGTKDRLLSLGLGIGMRFPGEPGALKTCVRTHDPRGFPTEIKPLGSAGLFEADISFPGRRHPCRGWQMISDDLEQDEDYPWKYRGTSDALIRAGLVKAGHFPGEPGMRKVSVTVYADGTIATGCPTAPDRKADQVGARHISRAGKSRYVVSTKVSDQEHVAARERWQARDAAYEARLKALPRQRRLPTLTDSEVARRLALLQNAQADESFQAALKHLLKRRTEDNELARSTD